MFEWSWWAKTEQEAYTGYPVSWGLQKELSMKSNDWLEARIYDHVVVGLGQRQALVRNS